MVADDGQRVYCACDRRSIMAHAPSTAGTDALSPFGRTTVEPTPRWVRVKLDGAVIADSQRALLVLQYGPSGLPTYYFPPEDVRMDALVPPAKPRPDDALDYRSVRVGNHVAEHTAWIYLAPPPESCRAARLCLLRLERRAGLVRRRGASIR